MNKQAYTYREGLHDGVPIALGYLSVSFGFGISVVSKGLSWVVALIISLTNETSAGQLAGLGVHTSILSYPFYVTKYNGMDASENSAL